MNELKWFFCSSSFLLGLFYQKVGKEETLLSRFRFSLSHTFIHVHEWIHVCVSYEEVIMNGLLISMRNCHRMPIDLGGGDDRNVCSYVCVFDHTTLHSAGARLQYAHSDKVDRSKIRQQKRLHCSKAMSSVCVYV